MTYPFHKQIRTKMMSMSESSGSLMSNWQTSKKRSTNLRNKKLEPIGT